MSSPERCRYILTEQNRAWVASLILTLDPGYVVTVSPPGRSLDQNSALHGYCSQIAKARPVWNGIDMTAGDYKALFVVSHAIATSGGSVRLIPDLEGRGLVQLREQSSRMSKERASSLLSYIDAWAASNGIPLIGQQNG
jgi:hypothetical protein